MACSYCKHAMMFLYIHWVFANYCKCVCANKVFVFIKACYKKGSERTSNYLHNIQYLLISEL